VQTAARRTGFTVSPDFMPEERLFVRSDQYAFIRRGVPSLMLGTGQKAMDPATDLAAQWQGFLKERYHKRTDDLAQPIDWDSGGAYAGFVAELLREIANDPRRPAWLPGDFFGAQFGRKD
jgi:Zn-dependent M28 family amino/carboxypeptidase